MIARRDLLMGGLCLVGAGAAYGLTPHRHVDLLGSRRMEDVIPRAFGAWTSRDVSDLVAPKEEDSLAARLYEQTVGRVYVNPSSAAAVEMLVAYGNTQTDDLQLHRPEVCYPAFGYAIRQSEPLDIPVSPGIVIPSRALVAKAPDREETVLYWSRLGEYFPQNRREQHLDRTRTAMSGVISDGVLARFSVEGQDPGQALPLLKAFVVQLVRSVAPANRPVLIGKGLSQRLATSVV